MEGLFLPGQQDAIFQHDNTRPPAETNVFPLLSLKGRTAIVTGGGAGIGYAAAETFAEAGANVAIWYNSNKDAEEKAASIAERYGVTCKAYQVQITDEEAVTTAIDQAVKDLNGRLDVFVANQGIAWVQGSIIDSDTNLFNNILGVNLLGTYYCAKAAGRHFKRQRIEGTTIDGTTLENYSHGSFIVTASVSGLRQLAPQSGTPYNVTKAALIQFVKCLAVEWIQFARVNAVSPAYITTEMLDIVPDIVRVPWKGRTPMGREGKVQEVKAAYLYLASDAASYTTGSNLIIDGGYTCM